ncbi:MAG: flavodoxin family protein [Clostridia bacterium]|nr:flavodoxin family protein [Clostridia bacterium]
MKILAINGSHMGEKGFTQTLLNKMREGAVAAGADFDTAILAKRRIKPCLGCEVCHTEKSYLKCVFEDKDDVAEIFQNMKEADIIVYATPVYVFNMSGLMKNFIDRINSTADIHKMQVSKKGLFFHHINRDICSKPFVLLTTCGNIENETTKNVVSYFRTFSRFMDAPMVGTLVRQSSFILQSKSDRELAEKKSVFDAFFDAGKEIAIKGKVSKRTQKRANQNVVKMPPLVRLLMKFKPLRAKIIEEGLKRNAV